MRLTEKSLFKSLSTNFQPSSPTYPTDSSLCHTAQHHWVGAVLRAMQGGTRHPPCVARNLLPLTGRFVTGWSHLQLILQKNTTKQPLPELSCCCSCAAASINTLDASCGSLKTRLFQRNYSFFFFFFKRKRQVFLPKQAENSLSSFTLPVTFEPKQTEKPFKVTQKPKLLPPGTRTHSPHGSVPLMLTWTNQSSDDTHCVSFFKAAIKE